MKNTILIAIIVLVSSCQIAWEIQDLSNYEKLGSHPLYYSDDFENLHSMDDIYHYIKSNVTYEHTCNVLSPEETLKTGKAGCGSFSVLFANIAYFVLDIKNLTLLNNFFSATAVFLF